MATKKLENAIRAFGMSGMQITDDLNFISEKYKFDLRHSPETGDLPQEEYYSQFEQSVRTEAASMSEYYEIFYCLENAIRKLISNTFSDADGKNWWDGDRVTPYIKDEVKKRQKTEIDSGVTIRSDNHIDYTTFGELSILITGNWNLFDPIFNSRRAVQNVMTNLNILRGPIAHCCPSSEDEKTRLKLAVRDWFRLMS